MNEYRGARTPVPEEGKRWTEAYCSTASHVLYVRVNSSEANFAVATAIINYRPSLELEDLSLSFFLSMITESLLFCAGCFMKNAPSVVKLGGGCV